MIGPRWLPGVSRYRLLTLAVLMALSAALPIGAGARSHREAVGNPSISLIIFAGTPTNPDVIVRGTDLDYQPYHPIPPKSPSYNPSNQKDCPVAIKGIPGYDYGQRLYFVDKSAKPEWSAGRYRPAIHELDCIGIIVTSYTSGQVEFHFGGFFKQSHYRVNPGDFVGIVVNTIGTGVHVKYDPYGVKPGT